RLRRRRRGYLAKKPKKIRVSRNFCRQRTISLLGTVTTERRRMGKHNPGRKVSRAKKYDAMWKEISALNGAREAPQIDEGHAFRLVYDVVYSAGNEWLAYAPIAQHLRARAVVVEHFSRTLW